MVKYFYHSIAAEVGVKQDYLRFEREFLAPYAFFSENTAGRATPLEPCPLRTEFQRDRDRILHSKAFRRLKHKTQVFLSPHGDHYRTRLTHTLEVTQIARTIARALRLNEDLTEAIALGHDLGHTPFGHAGERTLNRKSGHFAHNEQSLRVVDVLEEDGRGLNLTAEVRDGILQHKSDGTAKTLEGNVVSLADRIAYLNHDIDDAMRAGLLSEDDVPADIDRLLGRGKGKKINALVGDIVRESYGKPVVMQSEPYRKAMQDLRAFMFDAIYLNPRAKAEEAKSDRMIALLYDFYMSNPAAVPAGYRAVTDDPAVFVVDYIAGMTDNYAIRMFNDIFVPKEWQI